MTHRKAAEALVKEWRRKAGFGGIAAINVNTSMLTDLIEAALKAQRAEECKAIALKIGERSFKQGYQTDSDREIVDWLDARLNEWRG